MAKQLASHSQNTRTKTVNLSLPTLNASMERIYPFVKRNGQKKGFLKNINDPETELCAKAERKMLQIIGGDCETAIGGLAVIENNNLKLKAQLFSDSGSNSFKHQISGQDTNAINIGKAVGEKLLSLAGKEFKKK